MAGTTKPKKTPNKNRSGNPAKIVRTEATHREATFSDWVRGARLHTLPLAVAPVVLGTGIGWGIAKPEGPFHPLWALAALAVAVFLQIGANYANDYSDGIRGTDKFRLGPTRLTGSGLVPPLRMLSVALMFFVFAVAAGLYLTIRSGNWWFIAVGVACLIAGWFYTGGKIPYGYRGFGEVIAFIFFGLVATLGSTYIQTPVWPLEAWLSGAGIGLITAATLLVNNIRDRELDAKVSKRTLAVVLPEQMGRWLFVALLALAFLIAVFWWLVYPGAGLALFGLLAAGPAAIIVITAKSAAELVLALRLTVISALIYGISLGLAFWL